jgi:hypothetical protein
MRYVVASLTSVVVLAGSPSHMAGAAPHVDDACALLTPADIAKALSLKVGAGTPGKSIPGVLGRCTWTAEGNDRVIVTLTDARHAAITVQAWEGAGGKDVSGIGTKAVSINGPEVTGGWIVTVEDAKGGFGLSALGGKATEDKTIALAKVVESRR